MGMGVNWNDSDELGQDSIVAEINITPLTDVFLVLLIIFMVTSSVMHQAGVKVNLPSASQKTAQPQTEGVLIVVNSDGMTDIAGAQVSRDNWDLFESRLKEALTAKQSGLVILEADRELELGQVISIMDHARFAGAKDFAIAAKIKSSASPQKNK